MKRLFRKLSIFIKNFIEEMLMISGGVCILIGLSKWSVPVTWIMGGLMLVGFAVLIGKWKANAKSKVEVKNADNRSS